MTALSFLKDGHEEGAYVVNLEVVKGEMVYRLQIEMVHIQTQAGRQHYQQFKEVVTSYGFQ